ncbi:cytochrome P450 [Arthrobacter sp. GCM10027362]|uniref:cytochrome P450 n=1 Tax=Arthrobacter sp. GCM10027362 TaxID=3273379 RepID=UPI0036349C58
MDAPVSPSCATASSSPEPGAVHHQKYDRAKHSVLGQDPPAHTRMRRIINKWFTPKTARTWVELTRSTVENNLDALGPSGEIEAVRNLSIVPTQTSMSRILDIPVGDIDEIKFHGYNIMRCLALGFDEEDFRIATESMRWCQQLARNLITYKRANPGTGLADDFVGALDRGELTEAEVVGNLILFVQVGHLDVNHLISNGLRLMIEHPDVYEAYRMDPAVRPQIINEIVRFDPPELSATRIALDDLEVAGTAIPAGSYVMMSLASANRDETVFPDAGTFDYTRPVAASQHLSFGAGVHGCAGQALARAEAEAIFSAVASRYSRLEAAGDPMIRHTTFLRYIDSLPIRLS